MATKLTYSVSLDGSSKAFSATDHTDLKPTGSFTVGGWIKTTSTSLETIFASYSITTAAAGIRLFIVDSSGVVRITSGRNTGTTSGTDYIEASGSTAINNGAWHFIVSTWDGNNLKIYVDGIQDASVAWSYAPGYAATNYVRVGCSNNSGSNIMFFLGNLKDVFIDNGNAWTQAQVATRMFQDLSSLISTGAYWKLENNGNDSLTGGHNLTAIGSPTYSSTPEDVPHTYYLESADNLTSMKFDGSNDALSITNHADLRPTGSFTIGAWVKTSTASTRMSIVNSYYYPNVAGIVLDIGDVNVGYKFELVSGKNTGSTENTDWKRVVSNTVGADGKWHFVVGTWDGSYLRIYVDGVEDATAVSWANAPGYSTSNHVAVGAAYENSGYVYSLNGKVKGAFIINGTAWDLATVKSKMFQKLTSSETNAKLILNLDGVLTDSSGNSHDASLVDAPYFVPDQPFDARGARQSVYFNGSSTAVSIVDHADLKPTSSFTIGAWIKTSTVSRYFFSSSNYTSADGKYSGIQLVLDANGKVHLFSARHTGTTQGTDWQQIIGGTTITDSNWHFIVGTWDGSYLRIYVDGTSDATAVAWSYAPGYYSTNFIMIGANWNTSASSISDPLLGKQRGTFLINGTAWDATKIASYMTKNIDSTETNLKLLMNLDNNYIDRSGNAHNGTPISTPTFSWIVPYDGAIVTATGFMTLNTKFWGM